ncbi:DUF6665 family protein [Caulobacter sp. NIBR1757]|uniref:DUF6665 family protein n=1 Tax=Caulobacter sp. NIBR1757 TaxID=3016000 RepID=UPI0022F13B70|nr:DUF6665 family protein [Caulobacter sp. NIBR1757]WGM37864.1 hypothetical protein AMEJIAPC_00764 [Caulobacter sp. NIBR1757]
MSLRLPQSLTGPGVSERLHGALEAELAGEGAGALGRLGKAVEQSLATLAEAPDDPDRLKAAADAVWRYFVQREVMGLRDHRPAIRDYAIPRRVLLRLGAS